MADESRKRTCAHCGIHFWVDMHHVLPKSKFGGKGDVVPLCPNCHRDYHEQLGRENLKNPDPDFHITFFRKWMMGTLALVAGMAAYWLLA